MIAASSIEPSAVVRHGPLRIALARPSLCCRRRSRCSPRAGRWAPISPARRSPRPSPSPRPPIRARRRSRSRMPVSISCSSPAATEPQWTCSPPSGDRLPVIGIPAGVKMHSAVFGVTPRSAGELAAAFVAGRVRGDAPGEVMDVDESDLRAGLISPRLHGFLRVPVAPGLVQGGKARSAAGGGRGPGCGRRARRRSCCSTASPR